MRSHGTSIQGERGQGLLSEFCDDQVKMHLQPVWIGKGLEKHIFGIKVHNNLRNYSIFNTVLVPTATIASMATNFVGHYIQGDNVWQQIQEGS